jgi:hypothetical protein
MDRFQAGGFIQVTPMSTDLSEDPVNDGALPQFASHLLEHSFGLLGRPVLPKRPPK